MKKYVKGQVRSNGHYYVAEIPSIKVSTHGRNAYHALMSLKRLIEMMEGHAHFQCSILVEEDGYFYVGGNNPEQFTSFITRRLAGKTDLDSVMVPLVSVA